MGRKMVTCSERKCLKEVDSESDPTYNEGKAVYINESRLYRLKMFEGVGTPQQCPYHVGYFRLSGDHFEISKMKETSEKQWETVCLNIQ